MPRLTDPLSRQIDLSEDTWYGHIVKGHPEMQGLRKEAEAAILQPASIHFSASDENCRLYYAPAPRSPLMICVVAEVVGGFVKTAYLTKRIKPGVQEWPLLNQ